MSAEVQTTMNEPCFSEQKRLGAGFWTLLLILLGVYIAVVSVQPIRVLDAPYDDRLFFSEAVHIANGEWLGPYTDITLIKGPGYPIFLALCHIMGLPVLLAERLFYGFFCLVCVICLGQVIRRRAVLLAMYVLLLFSPGIFETPHATRIYRDGIYPALTGMILVCAFALVLRRKWSLKQQLPWSIGLGVSLAFFWLTREEGMWLAPSITLLLAGAWIAGMRDKPSRGWRTISLIAISLGIWGAALLSVSLINRHYYGFFGVVETKAKPLEAAYGALVRVKPEHEDRYIPVPRDARVRIYSVSRAFAQLEPYLEGSVGADWQNTSELFERRTHGGIAGGWFIFALRESVMRAGFDENPKQEMEFYRRLARQVNAACDSGKLPAGPRRSGIGPRIDRVSIPWIWKSYKNALVWTLTLPDYRSAASASSAPSDLVTSVQDFTDSLAPVREQTSVHGWAFSPLWGPVTLSLEAMDGSALPIVIDKPAEDGIYQYFLQRGNNWPSAHNARFSISTRDPRPCQLVVQAGNKQLGKFSLEAPFGYQQGPNLCMAIDSIDHGDTANYQSVDADRFHILDGIATVYQHVLPWLSGAALLSAAIAFIAFILGRRDPLLLFMISLLGAVMARFGVVALLDATSFPAINLGYLASVYPPLFMFIGAALAQPFSQRCAR